MCRVAGSSLRLFSTVHPSMSGRNTSSVIAVGRYCLRQRDRRLAAVGDDPLEALVAREAEQDARVVRIVVDDQQHAVAVADALPVVGDDLFGLRHRENRQRGACPAASLPAPARRRRRDRAAGPVYVSGRYSVNVLPWPGVLTSLISPPSSVASSRLIASPRPVPPYLRLVPASACWNASKISRCFSGGDADAGVADLDRQRALHEPQDRVIGRPARK